MKSILVLTPRFPFPAIGGDKLRIFKIIEKLSERNKITLLSLCENKKDLNYSVPKNICCDVKRVYLPKTNSYLNSFKALFGKKPLQLGYYWSSAFNDLVKKEISKHDIVLAHLLRTAQYVPESSTAIKILELTDAISLNYERVKKIEKKSIKQHVFSLEKKRVEKYERKFVRMFDKTMVVSTKDRAHINNGFKFDKDQRNKIEVHSNGVKVEKFQPVDTKNKRRIAFIGNMHASHNIDACNYLVKSILPLIVRKNKSIELKVVGIGNEKYLENLASHSNVLVTGKVDDIGEELSDCFCGLCILRHGAGLQNKILEYMAAKLPVVANTYGSEGINVSDGKNIIIANTRTEIKNAIIKIFNHTKMREEIATNALQYVKSKHDWDEIMREYERSIIDFFKKNNR